MFESSFGFPIYIYMNEWWESLDLTSPRHSRRPAPVPFPSRFPSRLGSLGDGEEQSGEIAGEIVEIPPLLLVFSRDIMYQHSIVTVFFLCSTEQLGPGIKAFRAPVF